MMELWRFIFLRIRLAKEFWWEWGISRKLLEDSRKLFPFLFQKGVDICLREILGVGSPSYC